MEKRPASVVHFQRVVAENIPRPFHRAGTFTVEEDVVSAYVILGEAESVDPDGIYFTTRDMAARIAAVHTPQWFRLLPSLRHLKLRIPNGTDTPLELEMTRTEVEYHYNISFDLLAQPEYRELWEDYYLPGWDVADERKRFVERFRVQNS